MAKVTIIVEDIVDENGETRVSMSSALEGFEFTGIEPLPGSMVFGLAMKNLFQGQWLSKNVDKIVSNDLENLEYEGS